MFVNETKTETGLILEVHGWLDNLTSTDFQKIAEAIDYDSIQELTLDLEALNYMTSAGVRQMLILKKKLGNKPFHLVNMRDNVREVLTIIGFLD